MSRIVETSRLFIREFEEVDAQPLFELLQDSGVKQYSLSGYKLQDKEQAQKWIAARRDESQSTGFGTFPILRKTEPAIIGLCGLRPIQLNGRSETELMYRLAQEHWGKGFATEAAGGLLDYGFILKKLSKIVAIVVPENDRSLKVVKYLGMKFVENVVYQGMELELFEIKNPQIK